MGVEADTAGLHIKYGDRVDGPYPPEQLQAALGSLPAGVQVWIDGAWLDLATGLARLDTPRTALPAPGDRGAFSTPAPASPTLAGPSRTGHTFRSSLRAAVTGSVLLGVPFLLLAWGMLAAGELLPLPLVLALTFPVFPWVRWAVYRLNVDPTQVVQVHSAVTRRVTTIDAAKIEGVETSEGPAGRLLGYGYLVITGTGGKIIKTAPLDHPAEVAERIRTTAGNRRLAPAATALAADDHAGAHGGIAALDEALRRLVRLREDGLLTDAEFATQKARLLTG
jgi:membrane protein YdbS with pleckstrin-like domain